MAEVRLEFSSMPSLFEKIAEVYLLKRIASISGPSGASVGYLGLLRKPEGGPWDLLNTNPNGANSDCSWQELSKISSLSSFSNSEKLRASFSAAISGEEP